MKTHFSFKHLLFLGGAVLYSLQSSAVKNPVDYVSTLVGTQSKFEPSPILPVCGVQKFIPHGNAVAGYVFPVDSSNLD